MSEKKFSLDDFREFLQRREGPSRTPGHSTRAWNAIGRNLGVPFQQWNNAKYTAKSIREVLGRNRTDPQFTWMEGQGDVRLIGREAQRDLLAFLKDQGE